MVIDTKSHCNNMDALNMEISDWSDKYVFGLYVDAMYPSIDRNFGIPVVKQKLLKHQQELEYSDVLIESIIDALIILSENDFSTFNGNYYLRKNGYSMGKKYVPAFTDIVMDYFDVRITNKFGDAIILYERYRDDVNIINEAKSYEDHIKFVGTLKDFANHLVDCINFTEDIGFNNGKSVNILNTTINITNDGIKCNLYKKPTKINAYLPTKSFHIPSTFKSVAIGLGHMIRSICDDEYVTTHLNQVKIDLLKVGYNRRDLDRDLSKYYVIDKMSCRNGKYRGFKNIMRNSNYKKMINEHQLDDTNISNSSLIPV